MIMSRSLILWNSTEREELEEVREVTTVFSSPEQIGTALVCGKKKFVFMAVQRVILTIITIFQTAFNEQ